MATINDPDTDFLERAAKRGYDAFNEALRIYIKSRGAAFTNRLSESELKVADMPFEEMPPYIKLAWMAVAERVLDDE